MKVSIGQRALELIEGDITEMTTDAIVNAANAQLVLGGGVAGAIRKRGGPEIQAACNQIGGTFVGGAVITTGGHLPARYVIHAVGPHMGAGDEDEKLKNATLNSLKVADENHLKSLAFPAISTGVYGYPVREAATIAVQTTQEVLRDIASLEKVIFCCFSQADLSIYKELLAQA